MSAASGAARLEELASRLYDLYQRKAGRFHTALIGVTTLVAVVFVLVFYPYATFRGQSYALEQELGELRAELAAARHDAEESVQLVEQYRSLFSDAFEAIETVRIDAFAPAAEDHEKELAAIKAAIGDDPRFEPWVGGAGADRELPQELLREHPELEAVRERPCFWRSGDAWTRCMLKHDLDRAHEQASDAFGYKRISHLRNELFVPLHDALSALNRSFGDYLLGSDSVWRVDTADIASRLLEPARRYLASGGGGMAEPALEVSGGLDRQYGQFRALFLEVLTGHEASLHVARNDFREAVRELERAQARLEADLATVAARLDEMQGLQDIETPFGTLPIGLNELTLLFPVLLAAGFMLCSSLFVESLLLRREFHELTRATDPEGAVLPDERIALIAPLWIDPLQPLGHRIYRAAILALPIVAYAAAIGLLLHNQLLSGPFLREARLNLVIYAALYLGSALVMLEGVRRTWMALRRYRSSR